MCLNLKAGLPQSISVCYIREYKSLRGHLNIISLKMSNFIPPSPHVTLSHYSREPPPPCHTPKSDKLGAEIEPIFDSNIESFTVKSRI